MSVAAIYLQSVIGRFRECRALGEKAFAQLDDGDFFRQPNEASNSLAIIINHLHGNMLSRWTNFLTEDGEKPWRRRDQEFEDPSLSRAALLQRWEEGWSVLLSALEALSEADLQKNITIRTEPLNVVDAINRQLGHYSYHVGQIVYLARWFRNGSWQSLSIPKGGSSHFNEQMKR